MTCFIPFLLLIFSFFHSEESDYVGAAIIAGGSCDDGGSGGAVAMPSQPAPHHHLDDFAQYHHLTMTQVEVSDSLTLPFPEVSNSLLTVSFLSLPSTIDVSAGCINYEYIS